MVYGSVHSNNATVISYLRLFRGFKGQASSTCGQTKLFYIVLTPQKHALHQSCSSECYDSIFCIFLSGPLYVLTVRQRRASLCNFHYYILSPNKMHRRDVPVGVPLDKCMARVTEV